MNDYTRKILDLADLLESTGGHAEIALVSPQIWAALGGDKLIGSMCLLERQADKPPIRVQMNPSMEPTQFKVGPLSMLGGK